MSTSLNWPSTLPNPLYPLAVTREDNVLRSNKDAGYEQTRRRYTRERKSYDLSWTAMRAADRNTIANFYDNETADGSLSFMWTHPIEGTTAEYRFTGPIKESLSNPGLYEVSCQIKQV